jgi:hypothetical protein
MPAARSDDERYCFHHVQAIIVAIDQYAETALGNREYFLNSPTALEVGGTITSPDWLEDLRGILGYAAAAFRSGGIFLSF